MIGGIFRVTTLVTRTVSRVLSTGEQLVQKGAVEYCSNLQKKLISVVLFTDAIVDTGCYMGDH